MRARPAQHVAFVLAALLVTAVPALAGGGGAPAVAVDTPPAEARVGEAVRLGFLVTRHGEPVSDLRPHLSALHEETKETFTVDAVRDADPGRYSVEATFHEVGTWFWEIVLESFGATTLPPLTVLAADAPGGGAALAAFAPEVALPAAVHRGTCAAAGEVAFPLQALRLDAANALGSRDAAPVKRSTTVIDAPLDGLLGAEHAVGVAFDDGDAGSTTLACGEIGGTVAGDALALGLRPVGDSPFAGVAVFERQGARTQVTTYLTVVTPAVEAPPAGPAQEAAIKDFAFDPPELTVAAGTTVTWTNQDAVPHTVSFDDMALADSPPLDRGDAFSVTFDTPGTYAYHCGPHPSMVGTVVVE